jgi:hypothetical protein
MLPSRLFGTPARVKPQASRVAHVTAPLKGLNLASKLTTGDPLTAPILRNFVVEDDRIQTRAGFLKIATHADAAAVAQLIPWYGPAPRLAAATNGKIANALDAVTIKTGFTSNDWHWTAFANLGQEKFTVMVNGSDGVWSWNGALDAAGFVKEAVTAPASATWIVPDQFQIVLAHMNRLFFADSTNLAVYYLPLQTKSGEVKALPLNALFRRGGSIRAMAVWTLDGGVGLNDQLVIFSTNGEAVIYAGIDPDTDFELVGIYRFDSPMSKHCVINYGGDCFALISTGLVPLSTMLRAESEQLGKEDKAVISLFLSEAIKYRDRPGWQAVMNPSSGRLFCNIPQGSSNRYRQLIRHMPRPVWSEYQDIPARCWAWIEPYLYFGDDAGGIYRMHPDFLNDNGNPIRCDVQVAWRNFGTPGRKHFKLIQPYMLTDGDPRPFVDVKVDYDYSEPENQPDVSFAADGAAWDVADWDIADWAQGEQRPVRLWQGVSAHGRVAGPRTVVLVRNCSFAITGWDVVFEAGAIL